MSGLRPARLPNLLRSGWLRALAGGSAVYALVTIAAEDTQNIHLVPAVLVLGALLVPVTFVIYLFERVSLQAAVLPALAVCFAAGGSVGVAAASILEYQTLRDLGALPMLAVGLIEESVKLAVALHALWDSTDGIPAHVAIGLLSGALLAAQIRRVRRPRAE